MATESSKTNITRDKEFFNNDHKATFRINSNDSWSYVSYDLLDLVLKLPNALVKDATIQDYNYDYNLQGKKFGRFASKMFRWKYSKNKIKNILAYIGNKYFYSYIFVENNDGRLIDQTYGDALAQMQVIVKKEIA